MKAHFLVLVALLMSQSCHSRVLPTPAEQQPTSSHNRLLLQNPDIPALTKYGGLTMEDMVKPSGYSLEKHRVMTEDGWALNMYRIPHGKGQSQGPRPVVLLHHGITLSSACFTLLRPNESMAYILADAGFDVWMANTRGNTFSRGNLQYSYRDTEYWYHSIDQYALIDAPAQVNLALQVSGAKKLAFVGHSQGASIAYAMLSTFPEMNDKISVAIHMGPVVFINYLQAPTVRDLAKTGNDNFFAMLKMSEFLWYRVLAPYVNECKDGKWGALCMSVLNNLLFGPSKFITPGEFATILETWPASVSTRNLHHWAQMFRTGELVFQQYDYGSNCENLTSFYESCNQQRYNSLTPPDYDLTKITSPQVIMQGTLDLLSTAGDIAEQQRRLQNHVKTFVYDEYSHMDFVWDRHAQHMPDMVDMISKFAPGSF